MALGCLKSWSIDGHIFAAELSIVHPPPGEGEPEWTTDIDHATNGDMKKYYLPQVLVHELGHAVGLTHFSEPTELSIMSEIYKLGSPLSAPTSADIAAYMGITAEHSH